MDVFFKECFHQKAVPKIVLRPYIELLQGSLSHVPDSGRHIIPLVIEAFFTVTH